MLVPTNAKTGNAYSGGNIFELLQTGYTDQVWATYRQWQELGLQVQKGEKGTRLIKMVTVINKKAKDDEAKKMKDEEELKKSLGDLPESAQKAMQAIWKRSEELAKKLEDRERELGVEIAKRARRDGGRSARDGARAVVRQGWRRRAPTPPFAARRRARAAMGTWRRL